MKHILKQSEVSVTNSKQSEFRAAVFRLTAFYSAGVFFILVVFSVLVYGLFVKNVNEDVREDRENGMEETEFHEEAAENLFNILLFSDLVLSILTVIVSYTLSKKTLEPLEKAHIKQKRFVADVAHELRTPLAVLKAGSEVLLSQDRSVDDYKRFTEESLEETERLIALSNDLLFLAQDVRTTTHVHSKVSLSDICIKTIQLLKSYGESKNITIEEHVSVNVSVIGSADDLVRLLLNLVKNAIDYNKPKGNIIVSLNKKGGNAILTVKDTGIGIPQKDIGNIFNRFYKVDTARSHTGVVGAGLGLSIVKTIVEQHDGEITVTSTSGEGSSFEVQLPLA
ncbi:MAG TPA: ATP-binding protein [Candidatus Paceibacterota bacterium]|nr:ATP-binding protein [Candidatus Paceibacterota bacterium]